MALGAAAQYICSAPADQDTGGDDGDLDTQELQRADGVTGAGNQAQARIGAEQVVAGEAGMRLLPHADVVAHELGIRDLARDETVEHVAVVGAEVLVEHAPG